MLRTTDQEVFKLFKLELCLTLLGGIAWIFEKHVYDVIGRKPAEGRRKKAKDVLEHYLFGGSVHWYHPLNNINAVGAPIPANHLFILIMYSLEHHTRRKWIMIMLYGAAGLDPNSLMPFSMDSPVRTM